MMEVYFVSVSIEVKLFYRNIPQCYFGSFSITNDMKIKLSF